MINTTVKGDRQMTKTFQIDIELTRGNADVKQDDISRAEHAAHDYFTARGIDGCEAQAEYQRQWRALDSHDGMTGLALDFLAASDAACRALTDGWHNPDGASCTIIAWRP